MRHLFLYWEGEDIDPDSGLPHITKAMSSLAVLRDAQIFGTCHDDRPPPMPKGWMDDLNEKAAAIATKYPNPVPPVLANKEWQMADREFVREQIKAMSKEK